MLTRLACQHPDRLCRVGMLIWSFVPTVLWGLYYPLICQAVFGSYWSSSGISFDSNINCNKKPAIAKAMAGDVASTEIRFLLGIKTLTKNRKQNRKLVFFNL
jgi:hypothetical protein